VLLPCRRLNQTQIKDLLAAARLPVSGTKKVQIDRLYASPLTSEYGDEAGKGWAHMGDGKTVDDLKADCKAAGLVQGGVKYDLVVRLIKHKAAQLPVAAPKAKAQVSTPAVGTKRKATGDSKAEGKKRVAASVAAESASGSEDEDEDDEDEEVEDEDEEARVRGGGGTIVC